MQTEKEVECCAFIQVFRPQNYIVFLPQNRHYHHHHHISIVFFPPPPPHPHFYCFPPPPPHFYCFPSSSSSSFLLFFLLLITLHERGLSSVSRLRSSYTQKREDVGNQFLFPFYRAERRRGLINFHSCVFDSFCHCFLINFFKTISLLSFYCQQL